VQARARLARRAIVALASVGLGCASEPPSGSPIIVIPPASAIDASAPAPVIQGGAPAQVAGAPSTGADAAAPQPVDAALPTPGPTQVIAEPGDEAAYIYDQSQLRTYELRLAQADLDTLDADPAAEEYVPGTLVFEGREYPSVGIRYKGSAGAFIGCVGGGGSIENPSGPKTCRKLSMKVAFDFTDPEGRFYGLRKLQFHAMRNDPSLMRERLGYALFREMGVAAPRAVHARLIVNGRLEGFFAVVEQIDGRFTRSRFTDGGDGNLYKEVWPIHDTAGVYLNALETNEDANPNVVPMQSFAAALTAADGEALLDVVDTYLGRDAILSYLAVDRGIAHADGPLGFYCGVPAGQGNNPGPIGNHNYYWYEETTAPRFWIVPWDLDFTFNARGFGGRMEAAWDEPVSGMTCACPATGGGQNGGGGLRRVPAGCDKLVQALALLRDPYRERLREFVEGPFRAESVNAKLDAWSAQVAGAVAEQAQDPEQQPTVSAWQSALTSLRSALDALRNANVTQ